MGPEGWQAACQIAIAVGLIMTGLGGYGSWHFGKQTEQSKLVSQEILPMEKVKIEDSQLDKSPVIVDSPGSHVDNREISLILIEQDPQEVIERVTGTRDNMGLYVDGRKIGIAINPVLSEKAKTFAIEQIDYTKPWEGPVNFPPMEFRNYLLQIDHVQTFGAVSIPSMNALAKGVRGRILLRQ
jgi:hypothetical protein